jgi:hypothetical protein
LIFTINRGVAVDQSAVSFLSDSTRRETHGIFARSDQKLVYTENRLFLKNNLDMLKAWQVCFECTTIQLTTKLQNYIVIY